MGEAAWPWRGLSGLTGVMDVRTLHTVPKHLGQPTAQCPVPVATASLLIPVVTSLALLDAAGQPGPWNLSPAAGGDSRAQAWLCHHR